MQKSFPRRPYLIIWSLTAGAQLLLWFFSGWFLVFDKGEQATPIQLCTYWGPFVVVPLIAVALRGGGHRTLGVAVIFQYATLAVMTYLLLANGLPPVEVVISFFLPYMLAGLVAAWLGCTRRTRDAFGGPRWIPLH